MVQLQSTILVQVISARGQSPSLGADNMLVEVRAFVDNGKTKAACQTVAGTGPAGQCIIGMRAAVQTNAVSLPSTRLIGTKIDRYA